jgi:signal recognition particle receptor subunit beta
MAVFNYEGEEINAKIVYYGPGLSGKTTNLEFIYAKLPRENKGKMVSMKTRTDRTLFFDFLPIEVGGINGMKIRFLLYTVPGQVYYNATRKLVLKGVDAVVFVADSAPDRMQDNRESLRNLEENLNDLSMSLKEIPWVIQLNKRDLPNRMERAVMENELNTQKVPSFEAVATEGKGVYETFEAIGALVISRMQRELRRVQPARSSPASGGGRESRSVDFEIVAKGRSAIRSSETDEGESIHHAEEREEERESVSEFVDQALREGGEESIDLGATREGYEDYGHLVDLNDEGNKKPPKAIADPAPEEMEIISDPLGAPAKGGASGAETVGSGAPVEGTSAERIVRIPVAISREEIERHVAVKVLLEVVVK